jgi:hypothetical protein
MSGGDVVQRYIKLRGELLRTEQAIADCERDLEAMRYTQAEIGRRQAVLRRRQTDLLVRIAELED